MSITHKFVNSNTIGGIGESIFFSLLSSLGDVESVVNDKKWQKLGVDFVLDGVRYDTKFDTKAMATGNIALETVSRKKDGQIIKKGWVYESKADCIVYIYLENSDWSAYFFTPAETRELVKQHPNNIKLIKNFGYESEVILIPLDSLSHKKKLSFPVVGANPDLSILEFVHDYLKKENHARK